MSQQEFFDLADQYLRKELNDSDAAAFEAFCAENPSFSAQLAQHEAFIAQMQGSSQRVDFKNQLQKAAKNYHSAQAPIRRLPETEKKVISMSERFKLSPFIGAAAAAIIAVFSTLWISGYYKTLENASSNYSALRREMNNVQRNVNAHNVALRNINSEKNNDKSISHYGATGFMVTTDGYVVTNYHVINGADSVYLQNNKGESFKASIVHP